MKYPCLTYTGRYVDPVNLKVDDIAIEDIAHALALTNRYGGHTEYPYSVAQHSMLLTAHVPIHLMGVALLHDAYEAYGADVPRPLKAHLPEYQEIEDRNLRVIFFKFGLDYKLLDELHYFDTAICLDEMAALMLDVDPKLVDDYDPLGAIIRPMDWQTAEDLYLHFFDRLFAPSPTPAWAA